MTLRIPGSDGMRLAATDAPRGGPPVLLVHGFANNRNVWDDVAQGLESNFRPLAIDLRGHGDSDWSIDCKYSMADYAGDLPFALDALGVERAVIVGHSLGGNAATLFAARHPERVEALVLVDTGPSLSLGAMMFVARDVSGALRSYASIEEYRTLLASTYPSGSAQATLRMATTGLVRRIDGRFEPKLDPGILSGPSEPEHWTLLERELWAALRDIRCPSLLVRGGLSAMLTEKVAVEMTEAALADGTLTTLPRAGHAVMVDDAPGLLREITTFLGARARSG